jgi:hypothetical protein
LLDCLENKRECIEKECMRATEGEIKKGESMEEKYKKAEGKI